MSKPLLIGAMPPPWHGQSVAFKLLVDGYGAAGDPFTLVDLAQGPKTKDKIGTLSAWRALEYVFILLRVFRAVLLGGGGPVYLTAAQSRQGFLRDVVMIWCARLRGCRITAHIHGGNYGDFYRACSPAFRWLVRTTLRQVDCIVLLSEELRPMMNFDPALGPRLKVVPNSAPFPFESRHRAKELAPGEPVRVLYMSNLVESKGYFALLKAADYIINECGRLDFRFDFCGAFLKNDADDVGVTSIEQAKARFQDFLRQKGLEEYVTYHGVTTGAAKDKAFAENHLFVLPTRYNNEGQPISIIEALAFGMPVLSTRYRAIPDMVVDGQTGLFIRADDPRQIGDAILQAVSSPEEYARLSRGAASWARERFGMERHVAELRRCIEGPVAP